MTIPSEDTQEGQSQQPETTTGSAPSSTGSSPQQSTTPADNWENRYKGMQRTYDDLYRAHDALKAQVEKQNGDHSSATALLEATTKERDTLRQEKDAIAKERDMLNFQKERITIIAKDYPELTSLEAQDLLPAAKDIEEFKSKLEAYVAATGKLIVGQKKSDPTGATTPPGGANDLAAPAVLYQQMIQAQRKGDTVAYETAYDAWVKSQK